MSELNVDTINEQTSANGVTIDGVLIKDSSIASSSITGLTDGVDFSVQQFRLTANIDASADPITGFEVPDTLMQANFGSNVTESSGTFTFTKTGFYKVSYIAIIHTASTGTEGSIFIQGTNDNSSYSNLANATIRINDNDDGDVLIATTVLDITDLTNQKVKFTFNESTGSLILLGNSTYNRTYVEFERLGDT